MLSSSVRSTPPFVSADDLDVQRFAEICAAETEPASCPRAERIAKKVPIYAAATIRNGLGSAADRRSILAELNTVLANGPGVVVIRDMIDPNVVERATAVYWSVIDEEESAGRGGGDHYAKPGTNSRVWNSFQKLAERDPDVFSAYFGNAVLDAACEAWLGPCYRMTAQVNVVRPGGVAQRPHRDYHIGFLSRDGSAAYPTAMQVASQLLTLQGAIAHSDMSIESGPTQVLPFSHHYEAGFLAFHDPAFAKYFADHYIQLPLNVGDAMFFSPAVFHAAGDNITPDVLRMANLTQVSSAFGKPMENIDTVGITLRCYPRMQAMHADRGFSLELEALMTMAAEGYAFPGNLDRTPPTGGMAPQSERELLREALANGWPLERLAAHLAQHHEDRRW
jgi:ectoine hydroxylase-related dioxygenase (phytanoyl-CoA dioxygenase family)